jgi:hypothetical protein
MKIVDQFNVDNTQTTEYVTLEYRTVPAGALDMQFQQLYTKV